MRLARRSLFLFALAAALLAAAPARAVEWLISFEAVPSDESKPYAARAVETTGMVYEIGPSILSVLGLGFSAFDADIAPGGYQGRINPSVLVYLDGEQGEAEIAAAAFGYVFSQSAVMVWREAANGDCLVVAVELPGVTPNLADHFFRHAASVNPALASGFTVRGTRMLFVNLRGGDGKPLGGLGDAEFAAALKTAADNFGGMAKTSTGRAVAKLIEKEAYRALVGATIGRLDRLRQRVRALQPER
jgi:hypothetical protein